MDQGWAMVIAGAVASIPGIISTVMSVRTRTAVRQVGDDTAAVKEEVKNSHKTNLRQESDERHDEVLTEFSILREYIREELLDFRRNLTRLSTDQSQDRADIRRLENHPRRSRNGNENRDQH